MYDRHKEPVVAVRRDAELCDAEQRWLNGDSALPVVTLLVSRGAKVEAAAVARLALARPDCPDAPELEIELVEDGCVRVETLVERAGRSRGAETTYFGLAAQAAFLARDMLGTVRLLRESMAHENEWCSALPHVFFIRERATPDQQDLLDRAGIPQP